MIRQYRPEDAASCCQLICACLENDPSLSGSLREKMRSLETPQSMNERSKLFYIAVYESENRISGIAGLDMNEIRLLYVAPEQQRRGIGRALLDHLKPMAPPALFTDIFVYSTVQAAGFYKACGFVEKGLFCFDLSGEVLPAVFMTLSAG
jgi:hypothetical protein